jgi:hypothetical protein
VQFAASGALAELTVESSFLVEALGALVAALPAAAGVPTVTARCVHHRVCFSTCAQASLPEIDRVSAGLSAVLGVC